MPCPERSLAAERTSALRWAAVRIALVAVVLLGCSKSSTPPPPPLCTPAAGDACNGDVALCDRRFDEVAFATTHNAMSNADDDWWVPNQHHGILRQLEDGVRGLMLDTHEWMGGSYLCHAGCPLGSRPLVEGLSEIRTFLDCHPNEVVTLILESHLSAEMTVEAFEESGLAALAHAQPLGEPWPTLRTMIAENRRVVVLTDEGGGARDWFLDQWAHAWQNPYAAESADDFSCEVDRGSADAPIFVMNHFLTAPIAAPELAEQVNHNPFFLERAEQCHAEAGQLPNFVTVDFYDIGDVFAVVRSLNGLP